MANESDKKNIYNSLRNFIFKGLWPLVLKKKGCDF